MLDTMKNCENELATSDGPLHPMPIGEAKIPDDGSGNDSCSTMAWLFCAVLALVYLEQAAVFGLRGLGSELMWGAPWTRPIPLLLLLCGGWVANCAIVEKGKVIDMDALTKSAGGCSLSSPRLQHMLGVFSAAYLATAMMVHLGAVWSSRGADGLTMMPLTMDDHPRHEMVHPGVILLTAAVLSFLWLAPVNFLHRSSRYALAKVVMACAIAPLAPVTFFHIVVADYSTSLAKSFGDAFVSGCVIVSGPGIAMTENAAVMLETQCIHHGLAPLAMSLPFVCRMMQCFRRAVCEPDTRGEHLANALKYATAFPVLLLSVAKWHAIYGGNHSEEEARLLTGLWIAAVLLNSLYSFWWDIIKDWGLMQDHCWPFTCNWKMRARRQYPNMVYVILALINLVLRVTWSLKLLDVRVLGAHLTMQEILGSEDTIFMLSLLEVYRRAQWTVFRVEWEYIRVSALQEAVVEPKDDELEPLVGEDADKDDVLAAVEEPNGV